jgi:hypothetical protein
MIAILDPGKPTSDGGEKGHTPVVAVLGTRPEKKKEADESIPDTKGRESRTPKHFSLQIGIFLGTATVAMMAIADTPSVGAADGAKRLACYGRRQCPLWQYFSRQQRTGGAGLRQGVWGGNQRPSGRTP